MPRNTKPIAQLIADAASVVQVYDDAGFGYGVTVLDELKRQLQRFKGLVEYREGMRAQQESERRSHQESEETCLVLESLDSRIELQADELCEHSARGAEGVAAVFGPDSEQYARARVGLPAGSEDRGQRTEGRGQRTEDRGQRTEAIRQSRFLTSDL
jgi:hypothetical protein